MRIILVRADETTVFDEAVVATLPYAHFHGISFLVFALFFDVGTDFSLFSTPRTRVLIFASPLHASFSAFAHAIRSALIVIEFPRVARVGNEHDRRAWKSGESRMNLFFVFATYAGRWNFHCGGSFVSTLLDSGLSRRYVQFAGR